MITVLEQLQNCVKSIRQYHFPWTRVNVFQKQKDQTGLKHEQIWQQFTSIRGSKLFSSKTRSILQSAGTIITFDNGTIYLHVISLKIFLYFLKRQNYHNLILETQKQNLDSLMPYGLFFPSTFTTWAFRHDEKTVLHKKNTYPFSDSFTG